MSKEKSYVIVLSGFFGDGNVGDDLLQISVIKGLQRRLKNLNLIIFTSNVARNKSFLQDERVSIDNFDFIYSGRWGIREKNEKGIKAFSWIIRNINALRKSDIQLIGPGNIIKDNTNKFLATFWLLKGALSYFCGKPFAFFAIGVADVSYFHSKLLIKKIMNKANFITTRDTTSQEKLCQLGVFKPKMASFPDITFTLIDEKKIKNKQKKENIKKIGLNFANFSLKFFDKQTVERYKKEVVQFLRNINMQNQFEFLFFSFSAAKHFNDNIMFDFIMNELGTDGSNFSNCLYEDISDLKQKISTCDAFIGTRFHSIVFAIQECVPTVTISYDWKGKNFMKDAGLGGYALDVEGISSDQLDSVWEILKGNHERYFYFLKEMNLNYLKLSNKHFDSLLRSL